MDDDVVCKSGYKDPIFLSLFHSLCFILMVLRVAHYRRVLLLTTSFSQFYNYRHYHLIMCTALGVVTLTFIRVSEQQDKNGVVHEENFRLVGGG